MSSAKQFARVAVVGPLRKSFCYEIPAGSVGLSKGRRVLVPFGNSRKIGFYLGPGEPVPGVATKEILEILDTDSYFSDQLFEFCIWMADYYFANPADCLAAALPSALRTRRTARLVWDVADSPLVPEDLRGKALPGRVLSKAVVERLKADDPKLPARLVQQSVVREVFDQARLADGKALAGYVLAPERIDEGFFKSAKSRPELFQGEKSREEMKALGWTDYYIRKAISRGVLAAVYRERSGGVLDFVKPRRSVADLKLTEQQQSVLDSVSGSLGSGFEVFLLHGVTGSGKTIVYCHLARQVLESGRTVLVLTPEIALSGSTLAYFRGFFGDCVTVLHSAMTDRERMDSWRGIRSGRYRIVIGPRSAVFAPLDDIGLVVVDEEHDGSYKQDDPAPRFHGRDSAIMRAKIGNVPIVLGSATPSTESYHHAREGRYRLLELTERPGEARLPVVRVVDMRIQRLGGDLPYLSLPLKQEVAARLERDQQVILFLNRRGYSPSVKCADCGHVPNCPHCNVRLTYHRVGQKLTCHYCGYMESGYTVCSKCSSTRFLYVGAGTQKVEEGIPRLFSGARPVRYDSDTASGRKNAYVILRKFAAGEYNVLLGTQMVTKGLDLHGVTLVGVLSADQELDMPDFRASERTFAKLLQVAGRSGRAEARGEVIIQTYYPELALISDAARQDYVAFFESEIESRRSYLYPPFVRLINIVFSGVDEKTVESAALDFRERLVSRVDRDRLKAQVLGPAPCPLSYLKGRHRRHLLIKTRMIKQFVTVLGQWEDTEARFRMPSAVRLTVDVDPVDMM